MYEKLGLQFLVVCCSRGIQIRFKILNKKQRIQYEIILVVTWFKIVNILTNLVAYKLYFKGITMGFI